MDKGHVILFCIPLDFLFTEGKNLWHMITPKIYVYKTMGPQENLRSSLKPRLEFMFTKIS